MTKCYATGDVNATTIFDRGFAFAGGLVGNFGGTMTNCYATGNVSATGNSDYFARAGGLVGDFGGTMTNCYAAGNVSATGKLTSYAGSLCGINDGTAINCYATGNASATANGYTHADGLFGSGSCPMLIANCYFYDEQATGGGYEETKPCNAADLNNPGFFTGTLTWDIGIWDFSNLDFANGKYPTLKP